MKFLMFMGIFYLAAVFASRAYPPAPIAPLMWEDEHINWNFAKKAHRTASLDNINLKPEWGDFGYRTYELPYFFGRLEGNTWHGLDYWLAKTNYTTC